MKQISKIFFGLLFVSGLFLALPNQMFGSETPTITAFNLTANVDKSSYAPGDSITLTSLFSMGVCLNSAHFSATGTIVGSGISPIKISTYDDMEKWLLYGGTEYFGHIANGTTIGVALFKAPSVAGNYIIRINTTYAYLPVKYIIKHNALNLAYLYDMNNNPYHATNLPVHLYGISGEDDVITSDNLGKVITIKGKETGVLVYNLDSQSDPRYAVNLDGVALTDIIRETRTLSMDVPFTVVSLSTPTTPTGTLSASPNPCTIALGGNTCTTKLTLNIINPVAGVATNITKAGNVQVASGITPPAKSNIVVNYPNTTFYLNHNGNTLNSKIVTASCGTNVWDTVSQTCKTNTISPCTNGANNPPACDNYVSENCFDGIKNQNETSVDYGGVCAINGKWSDLNCPTDCGKLASTITRTCTNPAPSKGGKDCQGDTSYLCPATSACPISGDILNITFIAYPTTIWKGSYSTLNWSSDADECHSVPRTGDGSFDTKGLAGGSVKVYPKATTTYEIQCTKESASEIKITGVKVTSINIIES